MFAGMVAALPKLVTLWSTRKCHYLNCLPSVSTPGRYANITVLDRQTLVYVPGGTQCNQTNLSMPGILVLHGSGGVPEDMTSKGFELLADIHKLLVVYPDMKIQRSNNWGYRGDIPYFSTLLNQLKETYCLDAARIFVCGHSAGASMSLFLQNELSSVCAGGAVEGAVGHLNQWCMSKPGRPSLIIWNHADPVLRYCAPPGGEPAYYNLTISTLRRHGGKNFTSQPLPTSATITSAEVLTYPQDTAPGLQVFSFTSEPGTHSWADTSWCTFDATVQLVKFFLGIACRAQADIVV